MNTHRGIRHFQVGVASLCLIGLLAACSTDSPTEPTQNPPPPGGGSGSAAFTIAVTASPATLALGATDPSTIVVDVRRSDNGQVPANGTTMVLSSSLGELGTLNSGIRSQALQLINGRAQTQFFAGTSQGNAVLTARLESSVGQATVNIQAAATFFVSFVSPNTGSPLGGETVSVQGGGFDEPIRVTFGGIAAQIVSIEPSRIRCITPASTVTVPAGTTRPVDVQVTVNLNEVNQDSDGLLSGFVYSPDGGSVIQPQVFSVSPGTGSNSGGTRVVITGAGFVSPVQVLFGLGTTPGAFTGVEATVESVSSSQIVVRTPSATGFGQQNQNQQVAIVVRNVSSGFSTLFPSAFRYGAGIVINSIVPDQIRFDSQETVTIFGQGFQSPVTVNLAGIQATVLSVNGSEIRVRAPIPAISDCTDVLGPVQVINVNSGASDTSDAGDGPTIAPFRYRVVAPTVTGVSPSSFVGGGGNTVSVSGVGFDDPVRVVFGTAAGSVLSVNGAGTQISVVTPTATFTEVACNDNGDAQQGMRFQPLTVDVTEVNLLTQCESTLTGGYTYIPSDQSCRGDVAPPPPPIPQCSDTFDNDSDGFIDQLDPQCTGPTDNSESS